MHAPMVVPDDDAREVARTRLDLNLLVEAGAGSGKTTLMVDRVLAMLRAGVSTDAIAAVTFTRKAATELRERLERKLDEAIEAERDAAVRTSLRLSRRELDRAYVGTIHGFCGRLLREEAIAAGVSPDFQEAEEGSAKSIAERWFREWVAARRSTEDHVVGALLRLGIEPSALLDGVLAYDAHPDVTFDAIEAPLPSPEALQRALRELMQIAQPLLPETAPDAGWDGLQRTVRRLARLEQVIDWNNLPSVARLAESLERKSAFEVTLNRWRPVRSEQAPIKALKEQAAQCAVGPVADFLAAWRAYCYAPLMTFLATAARAWRDERARLDLLTFEDLLRLAAELLRLRPDARRMLGARWRHLLVDEFQDTDPLQAEVCLLLASEPTEGTDWRTVTPRPGALFVVGDPKQSIYRFRRADIQTYEFVRRRFAAFGQVQQLTANFRSTHAIAAVVNAHFSTAFASATNADTTQAPFAPMQTLVEAPSGTGVFRYPVQPARKAKQAVAEADALLIASHIRREVDAKRATASDFMVLTATKAELREYASALASFNLPAITSGAPASIEHELRELRQLVDALAEPDNAIEVVASLEGLFVGATPAALHAASQRGLTFTIAAPPADTSDVVGAGLARLHAWYLDSQQLSPASLLDRLLDETGLLPYAASQLLGDRRGGLLLGLVDALRDVAPDGGSLSAIREVLDATIATEDREYTLQPGSTHAVRVMNVHKAKGLEAPIVFLAASTNSGRSREPKHVIRRDPRTGNATGVLRVAVERNMVVRELGRPADWDRWSQGEGTLDDEERTRLLYVATTRAARSLYIAVPDGGTSAWSALTPALDALGVPTIELVPLQSPGRDRVVLTPKALREQVAVADARRARALVGRRYHEAVTTEAKRAMIDVDEQPIVRVANPDPRRGEEGRAWGRAVHLAIEAALRLSGAALDARLAAIVWHEFEEAPGTADAMRAERLSQLRQALAVAQQHPAWARLTDGMWATEVPIMHVATNDRGSVLREGVIDAIRLDSAGWLVVDWKSDRVTAAGWARVLPGYEQQVALYANALQAISGQPAEGVVVRVSPS